MSRGFIYLSIAVNASYCFRDHFESGQFGKSTGSVNSDPGPIEKRFTTNFQYSIRHPKWEEGERELAWKASARDNEGKGSRHFATEIRDFWAPERIENGQELEMLTLVEPRKLEIWVTGCSFFLLFQKELNEFEKSKLKEKFIWRGN